MMQILPYVLISVLLNTVAQVLLKEGMTHIGYFSYTLDNLVPITVKVMLSPWIVGGLATYVVSVMVWLLVLARAEVSYAYPLASLGYISTALAGYWLLHEPLTFTRIAGIAVIITGVYLMSRS